MINQIYQLISPRNISVKYEDIILRENEVLIKPLYLSLCHADQRYYTGSREKTVLDKKLPMALVHEACGEIIHDPMGEYKPGEIVVMIPNVPGKELKGIYENYAKGSKFLSSGLDGFMREYVNLSRDRIIITKDIPLEILSITEFISIGFHILNRFRKLSHDTREHIAIWGDGNLSFVVSSVLKEFYPNSKITVLGKDNEKLSLFSYVDDTILVDKISENFSPDHAIECVGGSGSQYAIDDVIKFIKPQGTLLLAGVSETPIPINTRGILEKGITVVGCSRSGYEDFKMAVDFLKNKKIQERFSMIVNYYGEVKSISDIHKVFEFGLANPHKTVFKWSI